MTALAEHIQSFKPSNVEIARLAQRIHETMLTKTNHLDGPDFSCIGDDDVLDLFEAYDAAFFNRGLREHMAAAGHVIEFGISKRMTSAGGKTYHRLAGANARSYEFKIAISSYLLFQTFAGVEREISIGGIKCHNRLEAAQRIMEHEIIHLIELLLWDTSSCKGPRFKKLIRRLFGHTEVTHGLITPREIARKVHGITTGDRVEFSHEGKPLRGTVNRITKRATVLVEDRRGLAYSDGKQYRKYYVPLGKLKRC